MRDPGRHGHGAREHDTRDGGGNDGHWESLGKDITAIPVLYQGDYYRIFSQLGCSLIKYMGQDYLYLGVGAYDRHESTMVGSSTVYYTVALYVGRLDGSIYYKSSSSEYTKPFNPFHGPSDILDIEHWVSD